MTLASSGTSSSSSTKCAPLARSASTTCRLCTISLRTYTGCGQTCRASSTMSMARSTPAQMPRSPASTICGSGSLVMMPSLEVEVSLSLWLHQHLHGLTALHQGQRFLHLGQPHVVSQERSGLDRLGFEQFHRASNHGRRVMEGPYQRELFVVGPARVHAHEAARGAAPKQYHGASPPHLINGSLPHLRPSGRVHRDVRPAAPGQAAQAPA